MCGPDVTVEAPTPSKGEEKLYEQMAATAEQQQSYYDMMFPLLLEQSGYELIEDPEIANIQSQIAAQDAILNQYNPADFQTTYSYGYGPDGISYPIPTTTMPAEYREAQAEKTKLQSQLNNIMSGPYGGYTIQQQEDYNALQDAQVQLAQTAVDLNQAILAGMIDRQDAEDIYMQEQLNLATQATEYNRKILDYMDESLAGEQEYRNMQLQLAVKSNELNQQVVEGQLNMQQANQAFQQAQLSMQMQLNQALIGYINKPKSEYEQRMEQLGMLLADRTEQAIKGELPVSEATQEAYADQRRLKEEDLKRQLGEDWANTTPGIQSMGEFDRNWQIIMDAERRGEISQYTGLVQSGVGIAEGADQAKFSTLAGLSRGYSGSGQQYAPFSYSGSGFANPSYQTSGLINVSSPYTNQGLGMIGQGYGNILSGYGQAAQPYQFYNNLGMQANMANAQYAAQASSGLWGGIGNIVGMGLGGWMGNPGSWWGKKT